MTNSMGSEKISSKKMNKEKAFELITGSLVLDELQQGEVEYIKDEFATGMPCEKLYHEVYETKCRLCERLETLEDADVELIIDNLLQIGKILSMKMYEYGALYGL